MHDEAEFPPALLKKFSYVFQNGIIERLDCIKNDKLRFKIHSSICKVIVKFFSQKENIDIIQLRLDSISKLDLSEYHNSELSTAEHKTACMDVSRICYRRLPEAKMASILSNSEMIIKLMRTETVDLYTFMDKVSARIERLEAGYTEPRVEVPNVDTSPTHIDVKAYIA